MGNLKLHPEEGDRMPELKKTWQAWLIYDRERAEKNADYIRMHRMIGKEFGFDFTLKFAEEINREDASVLFPDFAIVRTIQPELTKWLESRKVPAFNNSLVADICNDKGKTISYVRQHTGVPVVQTTRFARRELSRKLLCDHPDCVIKAVDGHGGTQVFMTNEPFGEIEKGIGVSDFVIQPFVHGPGKDVRIYVIGNEIAGAVERRAKNGFRANFSLGAEVSLYVPDKKAVAYVRELCEVFSFGMVGIDFLVMENGALLLNEIEDVVGARMLYQCNPGVALLERYFSFIQDKLLHNHSFMGIIGIVIPAINKQKWRIRMKSDIDIAREAQLEPIYRVAKKLNIGEDELDLYGKYKAKLTDDLWERVKDRPDGKLVLVTAINPTPAGEGKTTTTVGLGQAMDKIGEKAVIALREPSLGPCFGLKGGAAGGGYAQVVPMDELNLHFTGDFHAITSANNLLAAMLDNHIQQGNTLNIDTKQIVWKRCVDMNDRVLRNITVGLGRKADGVTREDHFIITVASEIMAILCLAENMEDLKVRLGRIIVAYTYDGKPVTARELNAVGAMAALLKDAIRPNLIQTLEHTPAIVHGGPFANIAHGCNSLLATKMALKLADYTITEAGFGADLGAEKFLDIKCRIGGLKPDAVVLVATVRALKYNGGVPKEELSLENLDALKKGIANLEKHMENIAKYGLPCVVTLNRFVSDTDAELDFVREFCEARGCEFALSEVWEKGGEGGTALAKKVVEMIQKENSDFHYLYEDSLSLKEKMETIAREIYGAGEVIFDVEAEKQMARLTQLGFGNLPVCMAKNQYSLSDDKSVLGRPENFPIHIREIYVSAGAGFVVAITGTIMTMPGLPKVPAAEKIDVDSGQITGLF